MREFTNKNENLRNQLKVMMQEVKFKSKVNVVDKEITDMGMLILVPVRRLYICSQRNS